MLVAAESSIQRKVSQDEGVVLHGLLLLLKGKLLLTSVDDADVPDDQYDAQKIDEDNDDAKVLLL
jgi:hypothetical protein